MNRFVRSLCAASILLTTAACQGQTRREQASAGPALQVTDADGGNVATKLGYGIEVNKGSTLHRRWYVLNDLSDPIQLSNAGVNTLYQSSSIGGDYEYKPVGTVTSTLPVSAYEIRFLLFDIWGNHMQTLPATTVTDFTGDRSIASDGSWRTWENDVSELLTVVAFVARARTTDGKLWEYDHKKVLNSLEGIRVKLTENELAPEKEKPKN